MAPQVAFGHVVQPRKASFEGCIHPVSGQYLIFTRVRKKEDGTAMAFH